MFWFEMPALVTTNTAADFLTYHQIYTIWGLPGSSVGRACDPCTKALSSLQQPGVGVRPVAICCMSPPLCLSSHCLSSLKLSCEYSHGKAKYQPHTHSWKLSRVLCKNICSVMLTNVETLQLQAVPSPPVPPSDLTSQSNMKCEKMAVTTLHITGKRRGTHRSN